MKQTFYIILACLLCAVNGFAQEKKVQNRPYTDLRPLHFGVFVGTHLQDLELLNAGPVMITNEEGTQYESLVSADQDRWDAGFTVGVLAEARLNTYFQFRLAPAMYFGTRHITYHNLLAPDNDGNPTEQRQELKTAYISSACDLIFAAPRFNNYRPYLLAGINPMINLSGSEEDILRLKRYDVYAEVGVGCDFYLPFFKLRPELKFMFGLGDKMDHEHPAKIKDKNMLPYAYSVSKATTKIIALTFYFE